MYEYTQGDPIMEELSRSRDMRELYQNMLQHLHANFSEGATYSLLVPRVLALVWAWEEVERVWACLHPSTLPPARSTAR